MASAEWTVTVGGGHGKAGHTAPVRGGSGPLTLAALYGCAHAWSSWPAMKAIAGLTAGQSGIGVTFAMKGGSFMEDIQLLDDVRDELTWDPAVNADHIGVNVNARAVTLTGYVTTFAEKSAAVQAAERVFGVRAIADEIEVRPPEAGAPDDTRISESIMSAFIWHDSIPESVKAEVEGGYVTLLGEVEWDYQRREAAELVRGTRGVKGLTNLINLRPRVEPKDVRDRVAQALKRNADVDARSIEVTTSNGVVHLHGHVHSWHEKRAAEQAAFAAPGVVDVDNEITITV